MDETLRKVLGAYSDPARVGAHFAALYASGDIPAYDGSNGVRSLVRFAGMVQDTSLAPGWGVPDTADADTGASSLADAAVLWAVSIPGASAFIPGAAPAPAPAPLLPHKFPLADTAHLGLQIKVYDKSLSFSPTNIACFVGILDHAPLSSPSQIDVPTLHLLFSRPVPPTIVPRTYPYSPPLPLPLLRDQLVAWIADQALAGDRRAAELVLLSSIARVHSRSPPIFPPSLSISLFPSPPPLAPSTPLLSHLLSLILPIFTTIPLSLPTLNSTSFRPQSVDEDLHSACLQLPQGTVCLFTETAVTEGTVSERGIHNLAAIQHIMSAQSLDYLFPYSTFTFDTDIACLLLTQGRKSTFFQTSLNIPLRPPHSDPEKLYGPPDAISLPSPETLDMYRNLVGGARIGNVRVADAAAEYIQEDFVRERKTPASITADQLVHRIQIARLLALSLHETKVTIEIWERTKTLLHD